jgi:hypothetical protein
MHQAKDYLPPSSLRRIIHLQTELLKASGSSLRPSNDSHPSSTNGQRALLSSQAADPSITAATNQTTPPSDPTALLLGVTGRNKLFAAGDKLRELIVPDVLASAVSVVGAGVGAGIGMGGRGDKKSKRDGVRDEVKMEALRKELDALMASSCVICEVGVRWAGERGGHGATLNQLRAYRDPWLPSTNHSSCPMNGTILGISRILDASHGNTTR